MVKMFGKLVSDSTTRFKDLKLQNKLILYFMVIALISVVGIGMFSYYISSNILKTKTGSYAHETVRQITESIDNVLKGVDQLSSIISSNNEIQNALNSNYNNLDESRKNQFNNLLGTIVVTHYNSDIMNSIEVYGNNGIMVDVPGGDYGHTDNKSNVSLYQKQALTGQGKSKWLNEVSAKNLLYSVRSINDLATNESLGFVRISLKYEAISNLLGNVSFGDSGYIIIVDEKGNRLSPAKDASFESAAIKKSVIGQKGSTIYKSKGKSFLVSYYTSGYSRWKIIGIISIDKLYVENYKLRNLILSFTFIILILAFIFSRVIADTFTKPIKKMLGTMKLAEKGDFSNFLPVEGKDEIGELSTGFNTMISKIRFLFEDVYKGKLMQKESEFKALQAQINPHFLYNTLETINWMAKTNGMDQICNMVSALGDLMRISISNKKQYVTIEEEISYIIKYLFIQKTRFRDKVDTEIIIDDDIKNITIPKLIIQPLVENAFVHGFERKKGKGFIKIKGKKIEDRILFEIEDNGVGMSEEELQHILSSSGDVPSVNHTGLGISSVHNRIQFIYGKEYGLTISSVIGQGTTVHVLLPYGQPLKPQQ
jgi:two-component system, sensor histidine kinase YesM